MNNLLLEKGAFTPYILFNITNNQFEIAGESSTEDAFNFYDPIIVWLKTFLTTNQNSIHFDIRLQYYNTGSSQALFNLLDSLNAHAREKQLKVQVNWHIDSSDIDMKEDVEDFREDFLSLHFNVLIIEEI